MRNRENQQTLEEKSLDNEFDTEILNDCADCEKEVEQITFIEKTKMPTSHKIRKSIFVFIGMFSLISLFLAHITYYERPGDNYLVIYFLGHFHVILGIIRFCTSLKTNLPILFRIQDFLYAFLTLIPIFNFMGLIHEQEMMFGKIMTLICLVYSAYWSIKIIQWKFNNGQAEKTNKTR